MLLLLLTQIAECLCDVVSVVGFASKRWLDGFRQQSRMIAVVTEVLPFCRSGRLPSLLHLYR